MSESLEKVIKDHLIRYRKTEIEKEWSRPGVLDKYSELFSQAVRNLYDQLILHYPQEVIDKLKNSHYVTSLVYNPENISHSVEEQAKIEYLSPKEWEIKYHRLLERNSLPFEIASLDSAYVLLSDLAQEQEEIIKRLVQIAQEQSLDLALKEETLFAVIREIYPTKEAYIAQQMCRSDILRDNYPAVSALADPSSCEPENYRKRAIMRELFSDPETKKIMEREELFGKVHRIYGAINKK